MKTLLLRPFVDSYIGIIPPSSIMYLSSYLKSRGKDASLIDTCACRSSLGQLDRENPFIIKLLNDISMHSPDIIGMTLFSRELTDIASICKIIKSNFKKIYIVLGGPHSTVMPQETLEQIPECDFVVRGDGEKIFDNLIEALSEGLDLKTVKGVSYRRKEDRVIMHNEDDEIIEDLDSLPFPDRISVMDNYKDIKYSSLFYGSPSDAVISSRGCVYQCYFCYKVCKRYRSRSPENVFEEIMYIVKNVSPKSIQIMDDSFTLERERCVKILDLIIKEKLYCRFKVRSRVNAVDKELLKKMKKAGVDAIVYGLESGSDYMLKAFNKKTTAEENVTACRLTKEAGINCYGGMILFYPGESEDTIKETLKFIDRAKPDLVRFNVLCPFPGTPVYNEAKLNGNLVGDWGVNMKEPWVRIKDFKDINEMSRITVQLSKKDQRRPRRIFFILKLFIRQFLKDPASFSKLLFRLIAFMLPYRKWKIYYVKSYPII